MGAGLPILLIGDGVETEVSIFALCFLRNRQIQGFDGSTLLRSGKAIGLLYDLYSTKFANRDLDTNGMQQLVQDFWQSRRYGDVGLGWSPVTFKTARDDLIAVSRFSDFCSENFGHMALNPKEEVLVRSLSPGEVKTWLAKLEYSKKRDFLYHLTPATKKGRGIEERRGFNPKAYAASAKGHSRYAKPKHFPPVKVFDFILNTRSLRNRMCWLLIFFGGLRISELAHIFVRDIAFDPKDQTAVVTLGDPVDGAIEWVHLGRERRGTRAAFLYEKYGRIPRSELPAKHPSLAGWKGMMHDDVGRKTSTVTWTDPRIGRLFWKLHVQYMQTIRLHAGDDHPYYFVAAKGDCFGEPVKLGNLRKQFYANAKKVGLSAKLSGVNPHGGRHFYGWYSANVLRLSKEITQKMIRHASMASTEIYYLLDPETVKREVEQAHFNRTESMAKLLNHETLTLAMEEEDE